MKKKFREIIKKVDGSFLSSIPEYWTWFFKNGNTNSFNSLFGIIRPFGEKSAFDVYLMDKRLSSAYNYHEIGVLRLVSKF